MGYMEANADNEGTENNFGCNPVVPVSPQSIFHNSFYDPTARPVDSPSAIHRDGKDASPILRNSMSISLIQTRLEHTESVLLVTEPTNRSTTFQTPSLTSFTPNDRTSLNVLEPFCPTSL